MEALNPVELVRERLEFVEIIGALNEQFLDPQLIRQVGEHGWTHPWKYFDALRNYLLLTCFDLLGQPDEFMDFGSWLKASSTKKERNAIIAAIDPEADLTQTLRQVHDAYVSVYGTRRAFYRYIEELMSGHQTDALFYSVKIRKIDPQKNLALEEVESRGKKLKFLFQVRNNYTHSGVNTGSPGGGVFPDHGKAMVIDGEPKMGWEPIHYDERGGFRYEYSVRNWPNVLIDAVQSGVEGK